MFTKQLEQSPPVQHADSNPETSTLTLSGARGIYALPFDVLQLVLDELKDDLLSTQAFGLCCVALLAWTRSRIPHRVSIRTETDALDVLRCYGLKPILATTVRSLDITFFEWRNYKTGAGAHVHASPLPIDGKNALETLASFSQLEELHLVKLDWSQTSPRLQSSLLKNFTSVTSLSLTGSLFKDIYEFAAFVGSFPQLDTLLFGVEWSHNMRLFKSSWTVDQLKIAPPPPTLRVISALTSDSDILSDIAKWYAMTPTPSLEEVGCWTWERKEHDPSPMFTVAGSSLRHVSLSWCAPAKAMNKAPYLPLDIFSSCSRLQTITFVLQTNEKAFKRIHTMSPQSLPETLWVPQTISTIPSKHLKRIQLSFTYNYSPVISSSISFLYLNLEMLDEVLHARPQFREVKVVLKVRVIFTTPSGSHGSLESMVKQEVRARMPVASQRELVECSVVVSPYRTR